MNFWGFIRRHFLDDLAKIQNVQKGFDEENSEIFQRERRVFDLGGA
jgi:hypothetical protein